MATSVENRQLINSLETVVPLGFKTGKLRSGGFSLAPSPPPPAAAAATKKKMDEISESEEEEEDWEGPIEALCGEEEEESILDPRDEGTADAWIKRNPSLIRLTGKHPFNSEPPLASLMNHGFITPVPLHYVRNHGPVPNATWHEWTVEVCGLVKRPTKFTMPQLLQDFTPRQFPVTLVCAGNRRKEQNMVKQTVGFNWGPAGLATSVWRGVGLRDVLKRCGILKGALNVCFEGAEDLPAGGAVSKYGTSIKREVAMDPSRDIIIAYMQNGELLAPDHGFPVRMIIPGFIGGRMVKWLTRIIVTPVESDNYYHYRDNRVLPSHVDAELANSEAWWYKPEYIINDLNINSVITTPGHAELLPINSGTTQRPYTLRGYAYSGGGKKVTRVEVTLDGGETWLLANLLHHEKPNKYGRYWCWCFWSLDLEVDHLLDTKEIAVRAWDETLNTQPEKLIWNLMGMMNNCWFRVKTNICKTDKGEIGLLFQHPTQPGNQSGGWMMVKEKKPSTPATNGNGSTKQMTMAEVKKHSNEESAWIVVHGHVYDCTRFLKDHPGGADSILINAGTDCTEDFDAIHSDKAKSMLQDYMIGKISEESKVTESSTHLSTGAGTGTALDSGGGDNKYKKVPCKLISKTIISHDVRLFRFALPSENQVLGLPVGKHIYLCATINGKLCMRPYTPTSKADQTGHFDLLVKIYFKGVHPDYPNGGLMSQYLESSVAIGSMLEIKGPLGHIEYKGGGNFMVGGKPMFGKKRLAMVAGGTGITPIYQVIQAVLNDPDDHTQIHLVYANRTEDDILLRTELDDWALKYPDLFSVWYVISKRVNKDKCWPYSLGYISESVLSQHIPEGGSDDTLALVCGPPAMIKLAVLPNLEKLNYDINKSCLQF